MKYTNIKNCTTGNWHTILERLGVSNHFLKNSHGPCPLCGGKDRFRFDDKNGKGTYYCNQCGPGDGFTLVAKFNGLDCNAEFKEVCGLIEGVL